MSEQRICANAVLEAVLIDNAVKGSKRKKIDHWKSVACSKIGITRMGQARWNKILEYGYANRFFKAEAIGMSGKLILTALKSVEVESVEVEVEAVETVEVETVSAKEEFAIPTKATHPPRLEGVVKSDLPQAGDMLHYRSYTGGVVQGEVLSSYCFVDMLNPNGTYQVVMLENLHNTKQEARMDRVSEEMRVYYANNNKLRAERNELLKEIDSLKAQLRKG